MFNNARADYAVDFIQCLCHSDDFYGVPFDLLPWQHEAVSEFYGTVKENLLRQYQYLYLEIPKKNGKSELAAALGIYHTFGDGVMRGEVYVVAADKSNASIVFNVAVDMIKQCPELMARCKFNLSTKELTDTVTGTRFKVMSSEAYSKHGYKPSCVIFDELHSQPNRDLWDIMTFGAGSARREPVWIVLTTAGDDPDHASIGWEIHEYAQKVLDYRQHGDGINDPIWLPYIYGAPDDADIFDEAVWYKANPSLGYTIQIETVRQEALGARNSKGYERLFRWLRLNQWVTVKSHSWLPLPLFDETIGDWNADDLKGLKCYLGFDLSATTDLTALTALFPPQGGYAGWRAIFYTWIPEEAMREREHRDKVPFTAWVKAGHVISTEGNAVDYEKVEEKILWCCHEFDVLAMGGDQWNSRMLTQRLGKTPEFTKNENMILEIPQSIAGMSPSMKQIERKLYANEMTHTNNPCARWCFGNVKIVIDGNENYKTMKNKSIGRIDITVSWINAMAVAELVEWTESTESIYDSRELIIF